MYSGKSLRTPRPVTRTRSLRLQRPRRRWESVGWRYSLVFVAAVILVAGQWLFGFGPDPSAGSPVTFRVTDAATGAPVSGAIVALGGDVRRTGDDGRVTFDAPGGEALVQIVAPGFQRVYGRYEGDHGKSQNAAIRQVQSLVASAPDAATQESETATEPSAAPSEASEPAAVPTATTEPELGAIASGIVVDANGNPIRDALVATGEVSVRTKRNGTFALKDADVSNGLIVAAPGYARKTVEPGQNLTITLERQDIKAAYLNGNRAGDEAFVDELIALINRTELNAVVIDIKEHVVFFETDIPLFAEADAVAPTYDPAALVKKFEDAGIYTIARLVVFNDPLVAQAFPELAVQNENGGIWTGWDDLPWVNPFKKELWQPNIDLALEAISYGFDEIQYDYIRFPSDGDLTIAEFGPNYDEEGRVAAIVEFLEMSRAAIGATGTLLAVDIFGIVAIYPDDQGIGQRTVDVAKVVDYVCPMIYPSHFDASSIDVGGEPNALPYETISLSMVLSLEKMPGMELKLRPWLQDFTLGDPAYGPDEVRAQILAVEEHGGSGWMLWNAASEFTEDALDRE